MKPVKLAAMVAALVAMVGLSACMEVEQTASTSKQGKYQGKADTAPWDNAPLAYGGPRWNKGDKASWETEIKARNLAQNEDQRIYQ